MFDDNRVIAMARSLGLALQQEETFRNYFEAKRKNDEDVLLQNMIDDFNELQKKLDVAFSKDEKDTEEIEVLSNDMNRLYQAIMEKEGIKYTIDDYKKHLVETDGNDDSYANQVEEYGDAYLIQTMYKDKAIEIVKDNATFTD